MRYTKFYISNYKAIEKATIDLTEEGLVLLLGVNESGKTSILRAIESFHYINDPEGDDVLEKYFSGIRNKREIDSQACIKAELTFTASDIVTLKKLSKKTFYKELLNSKNNKFVIERVFEYKNATYIKNEYRIYTSSRKYEINSELARRILEHAPLIQYYEDFKDKIPDYISIEEGKQYFDDEWKSVIEGLFYHANPNVSVTKYLGINDPNTRTSILNKVNIELNEQFTNRWNTKLKGNKTITSVNLNYDEPSALFSFTVVGQDKSTVFSVAERSKGALWYLSFLLKTEFRKRHLRSKAGKTLYLIDEPASNLHSSAQETMVQDFRTLASDSNVIYTTHSQYLIDKENLSNVYIVKNVNSKISVQKYFDYVSGKSIKTSYYQPIIDALEIQPFNLDVSWNKVLLVEGIYDYIGLKLFAQLLNRKLDYVIIPGTSASNLETLISLHIGWGAKTTVLLDNDEEGRTAMKKYKTLYPIIENQIVNFSLLSSEYNFEFEDLFANDDKKLLYEIANGNKSTGQVTKKQLQQSLAVVLYNTEKQAKLKSKITQDTLQNFQKLLDKVDNLLK